MLGTSSLRKIDKVWQFTSEVALEDFVWDNLYKLLNLTPLSRQYISNREICDILAIDNQKRLVILELKNTEDRYVVQQLTRYYHNLSLEKAFFTSIDYTQPIRLIAIVPSFHKHNLIDRQHLDLMIDFLQVSILYSNQEFSLQLQDIDTQHIWSIPIPYQESEFTNTVLEVSPPPQLLLDWIGMLSRMEQLAIIKMREKILSFDEKIVEEIDRKSTIKYGRGKSRPIAEIYFQRKTSRPIVFLWLPTPISLLPHVRKQQIGRIRLWSNESGITHVGHIPKGLGKMKLQSEWEAMPTEKRPRLFFSYSSQSMSPMEVMVYKNVVQTPENLGDLTTLALTMWSTRV